MARLDSQARGLVNDTLNQVDRSTRRVAKLKALKREMADVALQKAEYKLLHPRNGKTVAKETQTLA